jgi:RNA polymerase sigma factor (sigma-70 family)
VVPRRTTYEVVAGEAGSEFRGHKRLAWLFSGAVLPNFLRLPHRHLATHHACLGSGNAYECHQYTQCQDYSELFFHMVTQYWHFVYPICLSQVGHAAEAKDLTQEVFVRIYHDLAQLHEPAKFLPWLRQVARNVCRIWTRRQREALVPLDAIPEPDDAVAAAQLRRSELSEILRAMLAQVSPMSRELLVLRHLAGYSEAELAVAFGVPPATIKRRLREAREQGKRRLLPIVRELLARQCGRHLGRGRQLGGGAEVSSLAVL